MLSGDCCVAGSLVNALLSCSLPTSKHHAETNLNVLFESQSEFQCAMGVPKGDSKLQEASTPTHLHSSPSYMLCYHGLQ